jgi:hypothetical protein
MALGARVKSFFQELKRRKVFHVATVYAITAWAVSQGASSLFPVFGAPAWVVQVFIAITVLGFPIAVVLAWAFEVTPDGVVRDEGSELVPSERKSSDTSSTTALFGVNGTVRVTWRDASGHTQERAFDQTFAMGRDGTCAIRFEDPLVSRRHAEVSFAGGHWWLADLGSRNGTLLDGKLVTRQVLPERGVIRLSEAGPALEVELRAAINTTMLARPDQISTR